MSLKPEMTWEKARRRWRKMYKGKVHTITCDALGVPDAKEPSYQAANAWWRQKRAEIDATTPKRPPADFDDAISLRRELLRWFRLESGHQPMDADDRDLYERVSSELKELENNHASRRLPEINRAGGIPMDPLAGSRASTMIKWLDRLDSLRNHEKWSGVAHVPEDRTVGGQVKAWIARQEARVHTGDVSPGQHENLAHCLLHFRGFVGAELPVEKLDGNTLESYFLHLSADVKKRRDDPGRKAGKSRDYAAKHLAVSRAFIRYVWRKELIPLPRNIDSKDFGFKKSTRAVPVMSPEEVRTLVEHATGQLKLHLLLMINCGMTQSDVADLRDDEVDWEAGRIVRRRSKTATHEDVPVVDYKLWPPTFELLRQYRSGLETVLLTKSGARWAWESLAEGKYRSSDSIATNYNHLKAKLKRLGFAAKPLKLLRKTSATKIESHREYGRYVAYFLGHSPRTVKDKHYAAPPRELFDEIIAWLGSWYGYG